MSRIGKAPIPLPDKVSVSLHGLAVTVKGPKGELSRTLPDGVQISQDGNTLVVRPTSETRRSRERHGLCRTLVANMVEGVSQGYTRKLEIIGVGYRAAAKGDVLSLSLGFSHPVDYQVPAGITAVTPTQTEIVISGTDKQRVGQVASEIRAYRPPEPYKGKGVRYSDEVVLRKEAKKK